MNTQQSTASEVNVEKNYNEEMYNDYLGLENSFIFQDMIRHTIEANLPDLSNCSTYDIGYGTGFCLDILLSMGAKSYLGVDISSEMKSLVERKVQNSGWDDRVTLRQANANDQNLIHSEGPFDLVINSCAVYTYSYDELMELCIHMYRNTKGSGKLMLIEYHADLPHTKQRIELLAKYNHYISPALPEGERYADFSRYTTKLTPPMFPTTFHFKDEPVVSRENLSRALAASGFKDIKILPMHSKSHNQELENFGRAFGLHMYICSP